MCWNTSVPKQVAAVSKKLLPSSHRAAAQEWSLDLMRVCVVCGYDIVQSPIISHTARETGHSPSFCHKKAYTL